MLKMVNSVLKTRYERDSQISSSCCDLEFSYGNPYLSSGLFCPYQLDESMFLLRVVWCTFSIFLFHKKKKFVYANDGVCTVCQGPKNWTL